MHNYAFILKYLILQINKNTICVKNLLRKYYIFLNLVDKIYNVVFIYILFLETKYKLPKV